MGSNICGPEAARDKGSNPHVHTYILGTGYVDDWKTPPIRTQI